MTWGLPNVTTTHRSRGARRCVGRAGRVRERFHGDRARPSRLPRACQRCADVSATRVLGEPLSPGRRQLLVRERGDRLRAVAPQRPGGAPPRATALGADQSRWESRGSRSPFAATDRCRCHFPFRPVWGRRRHAGGRAARRPQALSRSRPAADQGVRAGAADDRVQHERDDDRAVGVGRGWGRSRAPGRSAGKVAQQPQSYLDSPRRSLTPGGGGRTPTGGDRSGSRRSACRRWRSVRVRVPVGGAQAEVLRVIDRLVQELGDVVVVERVGDVAALASTVDQP